MLALRDLCFQYGPELLFDRFSWDVEQGAAWTMLGPSGCGKTTLLYLLAGLLRPTAGEVLIHGEALRRPRPATGLILQDFGLLPWASVRQNVGLGLAIRDFYGPDGLHAPLAHQSGSEDAVDGWLRRFDLQGVAGHYPGQISGGQRQRTAIARSLVLNPDLLLMDEPFASLDAPTREGLQDLMLELQQESGLTLIAVTHTIEEAALLGSRVLVLGKPPHSSATVFDNPGGGQRGFRGTAAFQDACRELRLLLEPGK